MPNPVGAPPKLTPPVALAICASINEGCSLTVAAGRAGIIPYTLYLWNERGKRETLARAQDRMQGKPAEQPMSRYEEFYLMLESAKAEAIYSAETRVFRTNPLAWLKNSYPRKDWHEAATQVRLAADAPDERYANATAEQLNKIFGLDNADEAHEKLASTDMSTALRHMIESGLAAMPEQEEEEPEQADIAVNDTAKDDRAYPV